MELQHFMLTKLYVCCSNVKRSKQPASFFIAEQELTKREVEYVALSRDTTETDLKQRREIRSGTAFYIDQVSPICAHTYVSRLIHCLLSCISLTTGKQNTPVHALITLFLCFPHCFPPSLSISSQLIDQGLGKHTPPQSVASPWRPAAPHYLGSFLQGELSSPPFISICSQGSKIMITEI